MATEAVVTGVGAITPLGADSTDTWAGVTGGDSGITRITAFDPEAHDLGSRIVGRVAFDAAEHDVVDGRGMGRYAQLAVVAAHEAVSDAGLTPDDDGWQPERVGVSVGTGMGGVPEIEEAVAGVAPVTRRGTANGDGTWVHDVGGAELEVGAERVTELRGGLGGALG